MNKWQILKKIDNAIYLGIFDIFGYLVTHIKKETVPFIKTNNFTRKTKKCLKLH
jgi:hypothetical protein